MKSDLSIIAYSPVYVWAKVDLFIGLFLLCSVIVLFIAFYIASVFFFFTIWTKKRIFFPFFSFNNNFCCFSFSPPL